MLRASLALLSTAVLCGASDSAEPVRVVEVRAMSPRMIPIDGLTASDFRLTVDGKPQALCGFSHVKLPAAVGIILDISGSMQKQQGDLLGPGRAGVGRLLSVAGPQDLHSLALVADDAVVAVPLTSETRRIPSMPRVPGRGKTALLDGIYLSALEVGRSPQHVRSIVVFSDGEDNHSSRTVRAVEAALRDSRASVFLLATRLTAVSPATLDQDGRMRVRDLVRESGGYVVDARGAKEVEAAVADLAAAIRSPYLLYFTAPRGGREMKVKVETPGVRPRPTLYFRSAPEVRE